MAVTIPFITYPSYSKDITLDNIKYRFLFQWNTRSEAWTLSIKTIEDVAILSGIKLVLNYDLFQRHRHLAIPQGSLFVIDLSNDETKIAYDDFTNERGLQLVYFSEGEL